MDASHASRLRMYKSAKSNRNLSTGISSIDMNIENLLNSPKVKHVKRSSEKSIEDSLLEKHAISQINLNKLRSKYKAQELSEMKECPNLGNSMKNLFRTKSQLEIRAILEKISNKRREFFLKPEKVDTRRPQDVIEKPDADYIRDVLTRVVPKELNEKVDLKKMNLVEKTDYFLKKKKERDEKEIKRRNDEVVGKCTFKPDISKPQIPVTSKKSASPNFSKEKKAKKQKKTENNVVRPPPPFGKRIISKNQSMDSCVFLSENYSQISPAKNEYGFAAGLDMNNFRRKSRKMLTYNSYTTRK